MYKFNKKNKGFTIVEAIIAIFILTISVSSMLGVTASAIISSRYARNEIIANYLLQEAVDSIRNSRDTIAFQKKDLYGDSWATFLSRYGYSGARCFSSKGCYLDIENFDPADINGNDVIGCDSSCPKLRLDEINGDYNITSDNESIFTRWVEMEYINADEVKATAYIQWKNEASSVSKTQSLEITLLNWQK